MEDVQTKKKVITLLVILLLIGIVIYSWFTSGGAGVKAIIMNIIKILIVIAIIIIVAFLVYKIFFSKTQIDVVEVEKQNLIKAGLTLKPVFLNNLYIAGDREHGRAKVGSIKGFTQIQSYADAEQGKSIDEDIFIFKQTSFPLSLFESYKIFRCLKDEHSPLAGDVDIYTVAPIFKYGYYYPNQSFLDVRRIDGGIIKEAWRGGIHEFLKDFVGITKRATGLDTEHKKMQEQQKLLKFPAGSIGEKETRQ